MRKPQAASRTLCIRLILSNTGALCQFTQPNWHRCGGLAHLPLGHPLDCLELPVLAIDDVCQGVHLLQHLALGGAFKGAVLPIADLKGFSRAANEVHTQQGGLDPAKSAHVAEYSRAEFKSVGVLLCRQIAKGQREGGHWLKGIRIAAVPSENCAFTFWPAVVALQQAQARLYPLPDI